MKVAILMGSDKDLPEDAAGADVLDEFGVDHEVHVMSAHRTPGRVADFAAGARADGFGVIICGAGKAAHLAGAVAAHSTASGDRRADRGRGPRRPRRAAVHRADADRHPGGDGGRRLGRQRRLPGRCHPGGQRQCPRRGTRRLPGVPELMIERYSLPEMAAIWSEEHKLAVWKEVETLVVEAWVELGVAPAGRRSAAGGAARSTSPLEGTREGHEPRRRRLRRRARRIRRLRRRVGPLRPHLVRRARHRPGRHPARRGRPAPGPVADLFEVVKRRALEHRDTVMIGRTHGIWAEPTSFGLKLATWAFEMARDHERMRPARDRVAVGKISGAVGTYAHTPPEVEAFVCGRLGIGIEPASSQITHRDRHAEFLSTLALIGASLERFATEIRHLQRSEVGEVREAFGTGQKGSSAMPHKRNPIASENVTGLARLLRGYAVAGLENVALWHERDISHSSVERVALPDASIALDFALVRMTRLVDQTRRRHRADERQPGVDPGLGLLPGRPAGAHRGRGMTRDEAYRIVQRNAMGAWDDGDQLHDLLAADEAVTLERRSPRRLLQPERFLRNSAVVFDRLQACTLR